MSAAVVKLRECLALQGAACDSGQRILQVCVVDHETGHGPIPHLHLKFHFGRTRSTHTSPWTVVDHVTLDDLRTAVAELPNTTGAPQPRLCIHPSSGGSAPAPTQRSFVEKLPRGKLSDASLLAGRTCPVCIECFDAGDELVVLPCQGLHVSHWACLQPWLATAHTCPSCRFELPTAKKATPDAAPMQRAWVEMRRLQAPPPAAVPLLVGSPVPRTGPAGSWVGGAWVVVPGKPSASAATASSAGAGSAAARARAAAAKGPAAAASANAGPGAIPPLVALVRDGTAEQKQHAARALTSLAADDADHLVAIAAAGAISPLVALVRDGTSSQKVSATMALRPLARNDANRATIEAEGAVAPHYDTVQPRGSQQGADAGAWRYARRLLARARRSSGRVGALYDC